jgi:SAM-dependent methyltransferase
MHPASTIVHRKYWSLDVSRDAVSLGREDFPEAHWVFYNRYNFSFNPEGIRDLPLPFKHERFNLILAYSVFTHIGLKEMKPLVEHLRDLLAPGGRLAFSFIDHAHCSWPEEYAGTNLEWRLEQIIKRRELKLNVAEYLERASGAAWCILADDIDLYIENEDLADYAPNHGKSFHVYHTAGFMRKLYPEAEIRPPVNREMHHCCIIRKA